MIIMSSMEIKLLVISLFIIAFIPSVSSLDEVATWDTSCFNTTHQLKSGLILDDNAGGFILSSNQTVHCPYDCDQALGICNKWPGDAISGEYFMLFEIIAVIVMFLTIFRLDTEPKDIMIMDVFLPLLGFILFAVLAIQGNNVIDMSTGEAIPIIMVVYFNTGVGFVMLMAFFFDIFKFARHVTEEGGKI
jgi:hypothetical protein